MGHGVCPEERLPGSKSITILGSNTSFELRDAKMDKLQQASESGMSLYLYVDGRYGTYSTNRLDKKELESFIRNGIESTLPVEGRSSFLPDASRYYKGKPDLQLLDPKFSKVHPDEKVALAKAIAEEAMGRDSRIISVNRRMATGRVTVTRLPATDSRVRLVSPGIRFRQVFQ